MKRVLLVNPFGIGDVLFTVPLLRALKASGVERIDVMLGSRTEDVLARDPAVHTLFSIRKDELKQRSPVSVLAYVFRLLVTLRLRHYDTLIDLSLTREYAFWSWFALGIKERIGFDYKGRGTFLTRRIPLTGGFEGRHVIEHYRELGAAAGVDVTEFKLDWPVRTREFNQAREKVERKGLALEDPYLVVAPGGGASWGRDAVFKQWAPEKFSAFGARLAKTWGIKKMVLLGSVDERELARRFIQTSPVEVVDLIGMLSLGESAVVIRQSCGFIGNDGGLLHVAKSLNVATVSIFGPVDPTVYGPFPQEARDAVLVHKTLECRPCYKQFRYRSDCRHRACLTELTVDEAWTQLQEQGFLDTWNAALIRS